MKTLLFSVLALAISGAALAEIPEIRAKDVTCQELQDAVRNYGKVTVLTKKFLSMRRLTVSQEAECLAGSVKQSAVFKTKDVAQCSAGEFCAADHVIVVIDHEPLPRHERWRWGHRHPRPTPMPHPHPVPRPDHDRPHRIPDHNHPGPHYNPRPDHNRPSHDRPSHDRPSHDRPSHDRPSHDRPSHDRPSHDRPSHDHGGCHGRRCSL